MKNKKVLIVLILVLSLGVLSINFFIGINEESCDVTTKVIVQDGYNVKNKLRDSRSLQHL
ncbi:hypothetical protein PL321_12275 [Caloramator sp. mosi_1]|uniref:hypothetical protein n=1 Tax=Caloramator sp. mosi_1 TaxID=3023090 RepID=UPI00235E47FF|nr:hypothetical protein [Caloramator sp. mosi_1]WDC83486.1 hypothetical protein PL321_12275 [Caloramator sp. mosi_1]